MEPSILDRMNPTDRAFVSILHSELEALLKERRSTEILLGEWLHDNTLPIPSAELLEYLAMELLMGIGRFFRFAVASKDGTKAFVSHFVAELKSSPAEYRMKTVAYALARKKVYGLAGIKGTCMPWQLCITGMELGDPGAPLLDAGKRRVVRLLIESMTLRAIFTSDVARLEGLARIVRINRDNEEFKNTKSEQIAFQMLRWYPYLADKLGGNPQKSEMQFFLLEMFPSLSDSPKEWSAASKLITFRRRERGKKADTGLLLKIAKEAKRNGPNVKRVPAWRRPPFATESEDLPK